MKQFGPPKYADHRIFKIHHKIWNPGTQQPCCNLYSLITCNVRVPCVYTFKYHIIDIDNIYIIYNYIIYILLSKEV